MLAPILIVSTVMRYRQTQARYNVPLQLADKGVALSEQLLLEHHTAFCVRCRRVDSDQRQHRTDRDTPRVAVRFDNRGSVGQLWGLGLLPLMIGLGYLASWWLNSRDPTHG